MTDTALSSTSCIERIREILRTARNKALQSVNAAMVEAYWEVGREIVEEEQRGESRASYGDQLLAQLSARLTEELGKGFSEPYLRQIRQFYLVYRDRNRASLPLPAATAQPADSQDPGIRYSPSSESGEAIGRAFSPGLSWTHYRLLMRVDRPDARAFYEVECERSRWSVSELQRQISSLLFERLARSRDKAGVMELAREGHDVQRPSDLVKDPYVLEFVGLPDNNRWVEKDLEQALIDRLQQFLLELGRDLFFVARQRRITVDGDHFYVDLVFYHRTLRCFLLIDLKVGRLTQQDVGQMLLYTGYYEANEIQPGENPPIGLVLCTDKNEAAVRYTVGPRADQVFAARYQLHLPTEEELVTELKRELISLELERL